MLIIYLDYAFFIILSVICKIFFLFHGHIIFLYIFSQKYSYQEVHTIQLKAFI